MYERAATIRKWFFRTFRCHYWSFRERRNALLSFVKWFTHCMGAILGVFTSIGTRFYQLQNKPRGSDFQSFHECRKALLLLAKLFSSQYDHSCDTIIENYINCDGSVNGPPQARNFLGFATQNSAKNNVFWRFSSTISQKFSAFGRNFGISRIKSPLVPGFALTRGGLIQEVTFTNIF